MTPTRGHTANDLNGERQGATGTPCVGAGYIVRHTYPAHYACAEDHTLISVIPCLKHCNQRFGGPVGRLLITSV